MRDDEGMISDGLEVAPQAALEYVPHGDLEVNTGRHGNLEVYAGRPYGGGHFGEKELSTAQIWETAPRQDSRKQSFLRRPRFCIIALVVVLAVAAIVVGAVVGSRAHKTASSSSASAAASASPSSPISSSSSSSPTATGASPSSTSKPITALSDSLMTNSALSVTGWVSSTGYSIRLFYQGADGKLRLSSFDTATGEWSSPPQILDVGARAGTTLGSSTIEEQTYFGFTNTKSGFQVELFYLSEDNILQERAFTDSTSSNGSSSQLGIQLASDSKIVSYWPSVVYQTAGGTLQEMVLSGSWNLGTTQKTAFSGSSLAEIPFAADYPDGGSQVFYLSGDGTLGSIVGNSSTGWSIANKSLATIPKTSSIGAFAVQNKQAGNVNDKYLLYQDATATIQVLWQDDASGWKGPTAPPAFDGADNGTSIACLTPMAWQGTTLPRGNVATCRCYFQSNGTLKEVWFNGDDWSLTGSVPTT